ncbi:MAG TPA: hypothetical protein VLM42_03720 [Bryobacteraceae bacterium]|nr:hypothetical protein [Bryobacteraceae bacterium]
MSEHFWADRHFDFDDVINKEIHSDSPDEQSKIQSLGALAEPGSIGSQQAMVDGLDRPLPWVQDIVGKRYREAEGVSVVGSAYAPFIQRISSRRATLPLSDYAQASHSDFQRSFLEHVVRPDVDYYRKIEVLLSGVFEVSQITLLDLCRSSFTIRGTRVGKCRDRAAEFTFRAGKGITEERAQFSRQTFLRYIESDKQREWTQRRFADSEASNIIALGYRAEHGLLRFFYSLGIRDISRQRAPHEKWVPNTAQEDRWVTNYAKGKHALQTWLAEGDWWNIVGTLRGQQRRWRLLPVLHPSKNGEDSTYQRTRSLLKLMVAS